MSRYLYRFQLFLKFYKLLNFLLKLPLRTSALTSASLCVKNGLNLNGSYSSDANIFSTEAQL